jgi:cytochrome c553
MRTAAKYLFAAAVVLVIAGIFGGLFVMISGIVPIKASSGHWPITAALLEFAKRRSVATHTLTLEAPPLGGPAMAVKGASHYDFACEPCHGSPALQQPRIASQMTPPPPDLRSAALTYDPEDLFYIVKHGIKFTGMPAWPAQQRDDEIWAMVAFLQALPNLDAAAYNRLAGIDRATADDRLPLDDLLGPSPSVPSAVAGNCARCHGIDGRGDRTGAFPRLAGQRVEYLSASLVAYARGGRHSGIMEPVAATLGMENIEAIAKYYAGLPPGGAPPSPADPQAVERGRRIATDGVPEQLVPACSECHGPGVSRNPNYPRLAGQYADYIVLQLGLFRSHARGGTEYRNIMLKVAGQLTEEQMREVAQYYASLAAESPSANR